MRGMTEKQVWIGAFILVPFLTLLMIVQIQYIVTLHQDGVVADAKIIKVIEKKGDLIIGRVTPSRNHLSIIDGTQYNLTLQHQYPPGNIKIKWLSGKKMIENKPSIRAIGLDDDGGYSFVSLIGGWKWLFIHGFTLLGTVTFYLYILKYLWIYFSKKTQE